MCEEAATGYLQAGVGLEDEIATGCCSQSFVKS